ncbi:MAG: extracellular solute-binding protein [Chloroflexi bacterium]|nr:extracellular solute-binding protein [Chloroflexota bacterium]
MQRKQFWFVTLLLIAALMVAACGGAATAEPAAAPTTAPEATVAPTEATTAVTETTATTSTTTVSETAPVSATAPVSETAPVSATAPVSDTAPVSGTTSAAPGNCDLATDGAFAGVDPHGQKITWWHNHTGAREEKLKVLVDEFNKSNPCGITVDAQSQGNYDAIRDKVNASISAGEQPAALIVGYQNDQEFYQLNNALVDLNPYVDDPTWGLSADDKKDFYASFFGQSVHPIFDNQRLGFPPNRSMEVLYYNATWLKELGYDAPPTTPEQFKEMACKAAAANGDGTGGYILRDDASAFASWTYAFGGDILTADGKDYALNTQATIDAMTLLKDMADQKCAFFLGDPAANANPDFAARHAIFAQGSSSGLPFYATDMANAAKESGKPADEWGVTAIPHTSKDPKQNVYGGDVMLTVTNPEQQLAAWLFVKWFTTPETQAKWDVISGYFPTRASTLDLLGDYVKKNKQWGQAVELLPFAYYEPQLISYTAVRDEMKKSFHEIIQGAEIKATLDALNTSASEKQAELMKEVK